MKTAYATIKGFEVMRMIRRRHCMLIEPGVTGEVRFVNKLCDLGVATRKLAACTPDETKQVLPFTPRAATPWS